MSQSNSPARFALKSKRVLRGGKFEEACVLVEDGIIKDVITTTANGTLPSLPAGFVVHDVGDKVVMPGLVDSHVHINEPGRTEWEGFDTATRAAAAGGITTVADMPLNCIPVTTSAAAFDEKLRHIEGRLWVDLCFWGGVVPGNTRELDRMIDQGVMGFKCFLIHSGIDDFPNVEREDLESAMPVLARRGVPLLVHAELDHENHEHKPHVDEPRTYKHFLESRPRRWENEAIDLMIELCRKHNCRVHIVHLSSSDAIAAIKKARTEGLPLTTETCPHYLTLAAEDIKDGDTRFKCAPPIRERENSDKLWQGLQDGTIDLVVSDHSPCTPELKHMEAGDFHKAWGGIASLQFGLPAVWTEAKKRGISLPTVLSCMSLGPARFLGLDHKKAALAQGFDADIVVFDPEASFVVEPSMIQHRHKVTPHEGRRFDGLVCETYVRGNKVYDNGHFAKEPCGKAMMRNKLGEKVDANINS
ncbi:MAG: allantoinase AllB [Cyanobacteria bacterium SZAS TMP-1]|nr:allantoinase AllB [Cyanobacteria bacterium SZAS TMP-1]